MNNSIISASTSYTMVFHLAGNWHRRLASVFTTAITMLMEQDVVMILRLQADVQKTDHISIIG